jgi:hypothetical protein
LSTTLHGRWRKEERHGKGRVTQRAPRHTRGGRRRATDEPRVVPLGEPQLQHRPGRGRRVAVIHLSADATRAGRERGSGCGRAGK